MSVRRKMKYYAIQPEVAGGWGSNTLVEDRSIHPPRVKKLHYQFDGWLGDVILETFPCYIVTEEAKRNVEAAGATGVKFDEVEITTSEGFEELCPRLHLPHFAWLRVEGDPGRDDFGIAPAPDFRLVISERMLNILKPLGISHALIEDFGSP